MKLKQFQSQLQKRGIDIALFLTPDPNIFYFAQISLIYACLAVPKSQDPIFFVAALDYERAQKESRIKNIVKIDEKKPLSEFVLEFLKKNRIQHKTIGISKRYLELEYFEKIKARFKKAIFFDISEDCAELRAQKTEEEIERIKRACRITDSVLQRVLKNWNFKTENQVEAQLNFLAKQLFADASFKIIVASGRNSSMPHHLTKNKPLQKGFCVIDFGVIYKGYHSDMTRTIFIGKPSEKDKKLYNLVLRAEQSAIEKVKVGMKCSALCNYASSLLKSYKKNFIHGLGHGIGIEVHEAPSLAPDSKQILKQGMTLAIEPGIYFPNKFGIRIEDDILLDKKPIILTKTPRELKLIRL